MMAPEIGTVCFSSTESHVVPGIALELIELAHSNIEILQPCEIDVLLKASIVLLGGECIMENPKEAEDDEK